MYVELHASSAFSFLESASLPESLVERAAALGYDTLALIDRDGVYGAPRFYRAACEAGIRPILGAALTIQHLRRPSNFSLLTSHFSLPVLVESREGYRNLCQLITRMQLRAPKGEGALTFEDLEGSVAGLVALADRTLLAAHQELADRAIDHLTGIFGRSHVYVEIQRHLLRDQEADTTRMRDLAAACRLPIVATGGVRFATPAERPLFDVLTCIRHSTNLEQAGRRLAGNSERYLKSPAQMEQLFRDVPGAIATSRELADRLQFTLKDLGYRFPTYPVPPGETESSYLRLLTDRGARERYQPYHDKARQQIEHELAMIEKLDLAGYFLIVWDIVQFCRAQNILVQGRGSAANSAVCYSLGITAVDAVKYGMLFERFLSEERGEWPDIDLDLPSGDRREQVIQHVYEKYGRRGAAMTANVITYRGRSAAREVGKALGLDPHQIDRLARLMNNFEFTEPGDPLPSRLAEIGWSADQPGLQQFGDLWRRIQDLPRHLGQHSGGMVICQDHLDAVVPIENASMPNRTVIQWDKEDCADLGIVKVDLLGLGMMAALQDAITLVDQTVAPGAFDIAHLPDDDPGVYELLRQADTIGVFQVESRAQMATLPRLAPSRFYDIVVEVAIIRPGPIVGKMVHPFLNRRSGREPVAYAHPSLEPILDRTLGVPLFQEQLLRMAMVAAGFTGGQAEELRRAMGFKRSEKRMQKIEVQLREGMARKGITGAQADEIVTSITSFALYGFPESHAISFALLAYASAYLKVHFGDVFYTALLNNQPMGFYHPATLVKEAQRRGVRFAPIDVQHSNWLCTIESDTSNGPSDRRIRLGLRYVNGLRKETGQKIELGSRGSRGSLGSRGSQGSVGSVGSIGSQGSRFRSLDEFVACTGVRIDELRTLGEIGALNAFGHTRRSALWQVERVIRPSGEMFDEVVGPSFNSGDDSPDLKVGPTTDNSHEVGPTSVSSHMKVGPTSEGDCPLPAMSHSERIQADYQGTGLTLGRHPMSLRREMLNTHGVLRAIDVRTVRHGQWVRTAGAVITRQRPGTAKGFVFLTLEDETGLINVIVHPRLFTREWITLIEEPFLLIEGVLQNVDNVVNVRAERIKALREMSFDVASHDFH
jgi:error-prone DNA polymerase